MLHDKLPPTPPRLLLVKFFGGLSAIGAGLALGREGPSVQMGAAVAHIVGKISGRNWPDCKVLIAAGAGAGLATAFNAPIAGAVFVLEELVRRFDTRIAIAALGASAAAIAVARALPRRRAGLSRSSRWPMSALRSGRSSSRWAQSPGWRATLYNGACSERSRSMDRLGRWPVEIACGRHRRGGRGARLVRAGAGRRRRRHHAAHARRRSELVVLPLAFLLRFGLGAVSYAAPVPGGLFAPHSRAGGAARAVLRRPLPTGLPGCGPRPDRFRRRRHGRVLHRRGAGSGYRHRAGHRDDRRASRCCCR